MGLAAILHHFIRGLTSSPLRRTFDNKWFDMMLLHPDFNSAHDGTHLTKSGSIWCFYICRGRSTYAPVVFTPTCGS